MQNKVYFTGNTVRLTAKFTDFDDQPVDPGLVKVIIYDYKYNKVVELNPTRVSVGEYMLDFLTDKEEKTYIYEWYGEIDGSPALVRSSFSTKFI